MSKYKFVDVVNGVLRISVDDEYIVEYPTGYPFELAELWEALDRAVDMHAAQPDIQVFELFPGNSTYLRGK